MVLAPVVGMFLLERQQALPSKQLDSGSFPANTPRHLLALLPLETYLNLQYDTMDINTCNGFVLYLHIPNIALIVPRKMT